MKAKLYLIIIFMACLLFAITSVNAVQMCTNLTDGTQACFDADSNVFRQNINLWEGENPKYGINIINPTDEEEVGIFSKIWNYVASPFNTNKFDPNDANDEIIFEFQSADDFYNFLQQQNALGNVTLFTITELNKQTREQTSLLTGEILDWTLVLLIVIMETFKMILAVGFILVGIYMIFRFLPMTLNIMKKIVFNFMSGENLKVIKKK